MRRPADDPVLADVVDRYVVPDRRYLRLGGGVLRLDPTARTDFGRALGDAATRITPGELEILLQAAWRERKTAAWLIAVARRTEFRELIGSLLLASEVQRAGQAYCVALTCFGTAVDADLLVDYLDRYLPHPDLYYDQGAALGALLCLDAAHDDDRAGRYLEPGGLWAQWTDGKPHHGGPGEHQLFVGQLSAFAGEASQLGGGPGVSSGPSGQVGQADGGGAGCDGGAVFVREAVDLGR